MLFLQSDNQKLFLGRWGFNCTHCPGSGWCNIQWVLPFVTNPLHWAMCTNPHLPTERSGTPWLLASTCFCWNHKCFTWGGFRSTGHPALTISMPHWWAQIRSKQLSVDFPSFVGWLGRWSLVAANRTSYPPGHCISFYWPGQVGVISSDYCHLSSYF